MAINKTMSLNVHFIGCTFIDNRKETYIYVMSIQSFGNGNSFSGSVQINSDSNFELHQIMTSGQYAEAQLDFNWYDYPMSNYGIQLIDQSSGRELFRDESVTVQNRAGIALDTVSGIYGTPLELSVTVLLLANTALQFFLVQQQNSLF